MDKKYLYTLLTPLHCFKCKFSPNTSYGVSTVSNSQSSCGFNLWFAFTLKGSSRYGLPAPAVAVDYSQGNLGAPLVNPNFKGSQTLHRVNMEIL